MRQQIMRRQRAGHPVEAQPGQMAFDGFVQVELALVAELQQRYRQKGLADRSNVKQLLPVDRRVTDHIIEPI